MATQPTTVQPSTQHTARTSSEPTTLVAAPHAQSHPHKPKATIIDAPASILSGIGQIMFGDRPVTGATFLGGLALASPVMAMGTVVGSCIGSLAAWALRCDRNDIKQGLYGFNASLVGLASMVAFSPSAASLSLMTAGCVASTVITLGMRKLSLAHYTAPFVASTWATWAIGKTLGLAPSQQLTSLVPTLPADPFGALHGIGQVLFQESAMVGLIFAAGLCLSSRKAAMAGLLGSLGAGALATATGFSGAAIASGLLGYNAALCAIALKDKPAQGVLATVATLPICAAFGYLELPALTAPFVLATWVASGLRTKKPVE